MISEESSDARGQLFPGRWINHRYLIAAYQWPGLDPTARCVLMALAEHGADAWPAEETIAAKVNVSVRTIRRTVQQLTPKLAGSITAERRDGDTTHYHLDIDRLEAAAVAAAEKARKTPAKMTGGKGKTPDKLAADPGQIVRGTPAKLSAKEESLKNKKEVVREQARPDDHDPSDYFGIKAFCAALVAVGVAKSDRDGHTLYEGRWIDVLANQIAKDLHLSCGWRGDWRPLRELIDRGYTGNAISAIAKRLGERDGLERGGRLIGLLKRVVAEDAPKPVPVAVRGSDYGRRNGEGGASSELQPAVPAPKTVAELEADLQLNQERLAVSVRIGPLGDEGAAIWRKRIAEIETQLAERGAGKRQAAPQDGSGGQVRPADEKRALAPLPGAAPGIIVPLITSLQQARSAAQAA